MKINKSIFTLVFLFFLFIEGCLDIAPIYLTESIETNKSQFTPIITPVTSSSQSVRLAWFYKPPENGSLDLIADNFDLIILTHKDEEQLEQLINLGVEQPIYQYLLFVQIMDPGSCTETPYGNQVAYKAGDFCTIATENPDWFLRDAYGNIIRTGLTVYMDAGNEEYRSFWLERAKEMQFLFGWDAVFIDNVEASLNKIKRMGITLADYQNDTEYQNEVEEFLRFLYENYFKPQNRPVMANIIELRDNSVWFRYMQYLDGAMIESFAVDYNNRYLIASDWKQQMQLVVKTQAMGKTVILVAQGQQNDSARLDFAIGSYLLVTEGRAFFRYADSSEYNKIWLFDKYMLELGMPLGPAYQVGSLWKRDFEKGEINVDPIMHVSEFVIEE